MIRSRGGQTKAWALGGGQRGKQRLVKARDRTTMERRLSQPVEVHAFDSYCSSGPGLPGAAILGLNAHTMPGSVPPGCSLGDPQSLPAPLHGNRYFVRPPPHSSVQPVVTPTELSNLNARSHHDVCGHQPVGPPQIPSGDPSTPVTSLEACLASSESDEVGQTSMSSHTAFL